MSFYSVFASSSLNYFCLYRLPLRRNSGGLKTLTKFMEKFTMKDTWSDEEAELCIESLRIVFNLLLPEKVIQSEIQDYAEDDIELQSMLVKITRTILALDSSSLIRLEELKRYERC